MLTTCRNLLVTITMLLFFSGAYAATIERPLPDASQEATARSIFHELKCVVCEGQSIADSDASLAKQIRARVRELVQEGKPPAEIILYFRERYGDQILMTSPIETRSLLLWLAPFLFLVFGGRLIWRYTKNSQAEHTK